MYNYHQTSQPAAAGNQGLVQYTGNQGLVQYTGNQGLVQYTGNQGLVQYTGNQGLVQNTANQGLVQNTANRELIRNLLSESRFQALPRFTAISYNLSSDSLTLSVNKDALQCEVCGVWFPNQDALDSHRRRFVMSCDEHGICSTSDRTYVHAQDFEHTRCFVPGCKSKYRFETGWPTTEVKQHIKNKHYPEGGGSEGGTVVRERRRITYKLPGFCFGAWPR
jgi:hypothetical protein